MRTLGLVLALLVMGCGVSVADSVTVDLYNVAGPWNYFGLPLVPFDSDPYSVLAGVNIDFNLFRWDAPSQGELYFEPGGAFGNCLLGDGYYLNNSDSASSFTYSGVPDGVPDGGGTMTDMWLSLPGNQLDANVNPPDGGGWHLIAQPFNHDTPTNGAGGTGDNIWFTDGTTLKTWGEAVAADWVESSMQYSDPITQGAPVMTFEGWGDDDTLRAKMAYWVKTKKDNLALIVPAYNP